MNVWVALLNLENLYGSQESLMTIFQSALQQNEPLDVYRRLTSIYQDSNKTNVSPLSLCSKCLLLQIVLCYSWPSSCTRR